MEAVQEVSTKALTVIEQANAVTITDSQGYMAAGELWKAIKALKDQVVDTFKPIIDKAHAAHKEALAQKAKIFDPLDTASRTVKSLMEKYDREQEAIRQAEERRLQEIARKAEEDRKLQEALAMEATGNKEEAQVIINEEVYVPPVIVPKAVPKMSGGPVYRTIWDFEIINEALIPRQYLIPDLVKIGGVARALKKEAKIPGVNVWEKRV